MGLSKGTKWLRANKGIKFENRISKMELMVLNKYINEDFFFDVGMRLPLPTFDSEGNAKKSRRFMYFGKSPYGDNNPIICIGRKGKPLKTPEYKPTAEELLEVEKNRKEFEEQKEAEQKAAEELFNDGLPEENPEQ